MQGKTPSLVLYHSTEGQQQNHNFFQIKAFTQSSHVCLHVFLSKEAAERN